MIRPYAILGAARGGREAAASPTRSASIQAAKRKNAISGLHPSKRRFAWMQSDVYLDAKCRMLGSTAASAWMQTDLPIPGFPAADGATGKVCRKSAHFLPANVNRARSLFIHPAASHFSRKVGNDKRTPLILLLVVVRVVDALHEGLTVGDLVRQGYAKKRLDLIR